MQYTKLGNSGIEVSRLCLGCMSFGDPASRMHEWTLNPDASERIIRRALDLGINFFDTANNTIKIQWGYVLMEYKDKVKTARLKLMLSQADFAKKLGVVFSTINEWENGVRHPNYIMQRKFAAFCEENKISFEE